MDFFCLDSVGALLFAVPILLYSCTTISQYDDSLKAKHMIVKESKEMLIRSYQELLSDMDGLLERSTESASGLAERSFESKRRDFEKFLVNSSHRFEGQVVQPEQLRQFRRFVLTWLNIFRECSIDPIGNPKLIVDDQELALCKSIVELADLVGDRLCATEVRFITLQRDNDSYEIQQRRMTVLDLGEVQSAFSIDPYGRGDYLENGTQRLVGDSDDRSSGCCCHLGLVGCSCCHRNSYGCQTACGCIQCKVLNWQHAMVIFGLLNGFWRSLLEVFTAMPSQEGESDLRRMVRLIILVVLLVCTLKILCKFEDVDVVQQLQKQVLDLMKQNEAVEKHRENMLRFWGNAQQLTELWLFRTVPRLDVSKEFHMLLEHVDNDTEYANKMGAACHCLEEVERRLGTLEDWRSDGAIESEDKKAFGKELSRICQIQDFATMLARIRSVYEGDLMANLTPTRRDSGYRKMGRSSNNKASPRLSAVAAATSSMSNTTPMNHPIRPSIATAGERSMSRSPRPLPRKSLLAHAS